MKRILIAVLVVTCTCATVSVAQEITGSVVGTVTDSSGAIISGALVTTTNTDKNVDVRTVTTNQNGYYVVTFLPIGHYAVRVEAKGFKTYTRTGITLNVNDQLTINAELQPGDVKETVTVEADVTPIELQTATASGLITGVGTYNDGAGGLSDGKRAFLLDASSLVPEPSTTALAMISAAAIFARRPPTTRP